MSRGKGVGGLGAGATEAVGAAHRRPCVARVHGLPHNSLRSLRSLRSNRCGKSVHEARCARGHEPCATRRFPRARIQPTHPFAATPVGTPLSARHRWGLSGRRCPAGPLCVAPSRRAGTQTVRWTVCALRASGPVGPARPARPALRGARAARFAITSAASCLNAVSAANEVSYAAPPRGEQRRGVGLQGRPPQSAATPGTACRDAPEHCARRDGKGDAAIDTRRGN